MSDKLNKAARSRVMSSIKNKNTKPELNIRKALFANGIRYGLHNRKLPGCPDLVFSKYKAIIFIHGCFWHNHQCKYGRLPETNHEFWAEKLRGNALRDKRNIKRLKNMGWRVKIIWSCSLKNRIKFDSAQCVEEIIRWLNEEKGISSKQGCS